MNQSEKMIILKYVCKIKQLNNPVFYSEELQKKILILNQCLNDIWNFCKVCRIYISPDFTKLNHVTSEIFHTSKIKIHSESMIDNPKLLIKELKLITESFNYYSFCTWEITEVQ